MTTVKNAVLLATVTAAATLALTACAPGAQPGSPQPGDTAAALPPAYLQIEHFQDCLASIEVGSHQQWCLPATRPETCPAQNWNQLNQLQGEEKVPAC